MLRKQCAEHVHRLFTEDNKTKGELSKRFWACVKKVSSVAPLKKGIKEPADILNDQFLSVLSDTTPPTTYHELIMNAQMNEIMIDVDAVHKQLVTLKVSAGPDGISD